MPPDYEMFLSYLTTYLASMETPEYTKEEKKTAYYLLLLNDDKDNVNPQFFVHCLLFGANLEDYGKTYAEQDRILNAVGKVWWETLKENGVTLDFAVASEDLIMLIARELGIDSMVTAVLEGVPTDDIVA